MDRTLRILILEDNESDTELVLRELREGGVPFEASLAATREDYLARLGDEPPDLILADYALPSFDGLAALAIAQSSYPDVPLIFVSGMLGEERAIETMKCGATDYVLKDRLSRLIPAVQRALGEAEERKKRREAEEQVQLRTAELEAAYAQLRSQHEQLQASQAQLSQREVVLLALSRRLVEMQERERSYVADRLYNEAAQVLAALKMQISRLERDLKQLPASTDYLGEIRDKLDRVLRELHHLAANLRPAVLDRLGLAAALQQYLNEFGRQYQVAVQGMISEMEGVRLPSEVETAVYRMAEEALSNVAQHAQASNVELALTRVDTKLVMLVQDDGLGFDVQQALRGGALGLFGMRERTEALGGSLQIESASGAGTTIIVEVPFDDIAATKPERLVCAPDSSPDCGRLH